MRRIVFSGVALAAAFLSGVAATNEVGAAASDVSDDAQPFALGCYPALSDAEDVCGIRISPLVGRSRTVSFVDVGLLASIVDEESVGLQISGLYNHIGRSAGILQIAGLYNRVDRDVDGLQIAVLMNRVDGSFGGMNLAVVNTARSVTGLQIGVVNRAKTLSGLQLGVVNYANDAGEGVQIGVVNVMKDGRYPVCPLLNVGF